MATFHDLTTTQLKKAVEIKEQIETLQGRLNALLGGATTTSPTKAKRVMSAATKRKMAAAQQARWAKLKSPAETESKTPKAMPKAGGKPKRAVSPEVRAKLAAAMKARWAARKKGASAPNASAK